MTLSTHGKYCRLAQSKQMYPWFLKMHQCPSVAHTLILGSHPSVCHEGKCAACCKMRSWGSVYCVPRRSPRLAGRLAMCGPGDGEWLSATSASHPGQCCCSSWWVKCPPFWLHPCPWWSAIRKVCLMWVCSEGEDLAYILQSGSVLFIILLFIGMTKIANPWWDLRAAA